MPQRKIIYILISVILAGLLVYAGYFFGLQKEKISGPEVSPGVQEDKMAAGEIGEVLVEEKETGLKAPLVTSTMPPAIFSASGTITEIQPDRIVLRGDGYNFADNLPRTITATFTADTLTFNKDQTFRWHGLAGLKQLKPGTNVLIEGSENIRGKTEFQVKTINIL